MTSVTAWWVLSLGTAAPRPSDSDGIFSKIRFKRSRSPRMIDEQNIDHLPRYSGGKITNVQKRWKRKYKSDFNFEQSTYIYVEYTSSYTYILFLTCSYLQYSGCPFYKMTSGKESSSTQSIDQYENIFPISKYISNVQIDQYENIFPSAKESLRPRQSLLHLATYWGGQTWKQHNCASHTNNEPIWDEKYSICTYNLCHIYIICYLCYEH